MSNMLQNLQNACHHDMSLYLSINQITSANVTKCYAETQPKTPNSKQCRCRSTVAMKNSLERKEPRNKPREEPGSEGYQLSRFWGYLYFTIYMFDNFYSTTFQKKIMYSIHFPWHPELLDTFWMLSRTGKWCNSRTIKRTHGHPYCLWAGGLTKQTCIICK